MPKNMIEKMTTDIMARQKDYIEMFAAAYLNQTNIPPDKAVLVQQWEGNTIRWWFEEKKKID